MVARVTRYRIRPGKVKEFAATVDALTAHLDQRDGFRALIVLRGEDPEGQEATALSIWDSAEKMKSTENDQRYYEAIKRLMAYCESFSPMHVHEVIHSKFKEPQC